MSNFPNPCQEPMDEFKLIENLHAQLTGSNSETGQQDGHCCHECYVIFGALIFMCGVCLIASGTIMLVAPEYWADYMWIAFLGLGTLMTFVGLGTVCHCSRKKQMQYCETFPAELIGQTVVFRNETYTVTPRQSISSQNQNNVIQLTRLDTTTQNALRETTKNRPQLMGDPSHPVQFGTSWQPLLSHDSSSRQPSTTSTDSCSSGTPLLKTSV